MGKHGLNVGDLVYKANGYRPRKGLWIGLILSFLHRTHVLVLSSDEGEIEKWALPFVKKLDQYCKVD
tara:strand:- start:3226 stop:3426 length:201 start_codon:yes stop_codon:yes gene_type:complete